MDSRPDGGQDGWRSLLDKRVALVVLVVGMALVGVGFGTVVPNDPGPKQYDATTGPNGATAEVSAAGGESVSVDFSDTSVGAGGNASLQSLNVTFDGGGELTFTGVSRDASTSAADPPTNDTVSYLNVSHEGDAELDSVTFTFTVRKSAIEAASASPGDVTLHRFHDGSWQTLETSIRSENAEIYTFAAVSPGLSVFAVSLSPAEPRTDTKTETPTETTPDIATPNDTATPIATPNDTATPTATDEPDPPDVSQPDPPAPASLSLAPVMADRIATDTGDVDAVTGDVRGTLVVNDGEATRAVMTVTVDSPESGERVVREVEVELEGQTRLAVADALKNDALLFATGARANEYTVGADGERRRYEQTVTVSVTVYGGTDPLVNRTETTRLVVTVQNLDSEGGVDGESNPAAD